MQTIIDETLENHGKVLRPIISEHFGNEYKRKLFPIDLTETAIPDKDTLGSIEHYGQNELQNMSKMVILPVI